MRAASIVALICLVFGLSSTVVLAKRATIGIYAIVDQVAFEPDERSPERIRIRGVFVVPVPMSSGEYKAPQRGYLYFKIVPGMEEASKQEWDELRALAGTHQGIGFAQYWVANSTDPTGNPHHSLEVQVHRDEDVVVPDVYPLAHPRGILKTGEKTGPDPDFKAIVTQLHSAAQE